MSQQAEQQTLGFQTEVNQLLHLVIHSLYSNKEIFLRELVSNASDANDKLRFEATAHADKFKGIDTSRLKIRVDADEKTRTITVTDYGIGMSYDEVISHLGTIAKSGTKEFLTRLTGDQAKDSHLIGQFGVGFYSSFIVADKVVVKTRRADLPEDQGVRWESSGENGFTIKTIKKSAVGTEIVLHIKEGEEDFLSAWRLRGIISKYSDHISWPIEMPKQVEDSQDKKPEDEKLIKVPEYETVNRATALWTLPKSEITDEQYKGFYKHVSHDFEDPMLWIHFHVEGKQHYTGLLYIPSRPPFDLWQQEVKHGLKLYVKRVFIMDDAEQFLPRYLRFVKGIIDASDLPLNVSREILQDDDLVRKIRAACVKRVLDRLQKIATNEPDTYQKFWNNFGLVLKEGPIEDFSHRETVAKLLRFSSTHEDNPLQQVALSDYVARMKEGQDKIYYVTAASFNAAKNSPHLEIFRKKGIEVLLLSDRIDEWLVTHLSEFDGKSMQSVTKGELDVAELGDSQEEKAEEKKEKTQAYESLLSHIKTVLEDKVEDVRMTDRLTASPACVVAGAHDMGREMQRIMQAAGQDIPASKPIFEINLDHHLVQRLNAETDDEKFAEWAHILFDQAVLAEGGQLDDPATFVSRLNKMLLALTA